MKVVIEKNDQGQFSVGTEQGEDIGSLMDPAMPQSGMQPATDVEDALNKARALLGGQPEVEQQQARQAFASA